MDYIPDLCSAMVANGAIVKYNERDKRLDHEFDKGTKVRHTKDEH